MTERKRNKLLSLNNKQFTDFQFIFYGSGRVQVGCSDLDYFQLHFAINTDVLFGQIFFLPDLFDMMPPA